jgi:hypothetical protein
MVAAYVKEHLEAGIKPRTANIDVIVLRSVLKEAKEEGLIQRLPMEGLNPRKVKTPVRGLLTMRSLRSCVRRLRNAARTASSSPTTSSYWHTVAPGVTRLWRSNGSRWTLTGRCYALVPMGCPRTARPGL